MLSELYLKRVFVEGKLADEDRKFYQQELRAFELVYCYPAVMLLMLSQITPDLSLLHLAVI